MGCASRSCVSPELVQSLGGCEEEVAHKFLPWSARLLPVVHLVVLVAELLLEGLGHFLYLLLFILVLSRVHFLHAFCRLSDYKLSLMIIS